MPPSPIIRTISYPGGRSNGDRSGTVFRSGGRFVIGSSAHVSVNPVCPWATVVTGLASSEKRIVV